MKYSVICPILGPIAAFAMQGDAEEWMEFYQTKYPEMTGLEISSSTSKRTKVCKNKDGEGSCHLHNLYCQYPACETV